MKHKLRKNGDKLGKDGEIILGAFITNFTLSFLVLWLISHGQRFVETIELSLFISFLTMLITISYWISNSRYKPLLRLIVTLKRK